MPPRLSLVAALLFMPTLASAQAGSISGTVTDAVTSQPVAGIIVRIYRTNGTTAGSATSDAAGAYTVGGLADGTYVALTETELNYVNELYDDVPCGHDCSPSSARAAPIVVAGGAAVTGRNFALTPGASISGRVTAEATAAPLAGITVYLLDAGTDFVGEATTDAQGEYVFTGLRAGPYFAATDTIAGWINEIYDNHQCFGQCSSSEEILAFATPIVVAAGATTSGRNFALALGGRITGTVTSAGTQAPLAPVGIQIETGSGRHVSTIHTNAQGQYESIVGLPTGHYIAFTFNNIGYLDEFYDNVPCPPTGCFGAPRAGATSIPVTAGATSAGRDFALTEGGRISGTILAADTGLPLAGVFVNAGSAAGGGSGDTSDASGQYVLRGLHAGSYALYTSGAGVYVDEIYDDRPCTGSCDHSTALEIGTPVAVTVGATTTGRDFVLTRGGRISGVVRDRMTSALLPAQITISSSDGRDVAFTSSNQSGSYVIPSGLPTGQYFARADAFGNHLPEIYSGTPCHDPCNATRAALEGTPISVTVPDVTSGVDFALQPGGVITGTVTDAATGAPLSLARVWAVLPQGFVRSSASAMTNPAGVFEIRELQSGSYALYTDAATYVDEVYDNVACQLRCSEADLAMGRRLTVTAGSTTSGVDFALAKGGGISGLVTSAATGAPAFAVLRAIRSSAGRLDVLDVSSDDDGFYVFKDLPPGTYYLHTRFTDPLVSEIYGNHPCADPCDANLAVMLGQPVVVAAGATIGGIDFALEPGGRITGTVVDAATMTPVRAGVRLVDAAGRPLALQFNEDSGAYAMPASLPAGTYYLFTESAAGFIPEIWNDVRCTGACTPAGAVGRGTPVVVLPGATVAGRDFALDRGGRVSGSIRHAPSGVRLGNVAVNVYNASGFLMTTAFSNSDGAYATDRGLPAGSYYAFTSNVQGFTDRIYGGAPCNGPCSPSRVTTGTPIVVTAGATTPGIDFSLTSNAGVPGPPLDLTATTNGPGTRFSWTPPVSGGAPASYVLEAGLTPGTTVVSFAVADLFHVVTGVPAGQFYLRVRGVNAAGTGPPSSEYMLIVGASGDVRPSAPRNLVALVDGNRVTLSWESPIDGTPAASYLVEAGSASGLANLGILPGAAGTRAFTYAPVPPGFYFLRVRAVNGGGMSPPSNEVMIVAGGAPSPPGAPQSFGGAVSGSNVTLGWTAPAGPVTGYVVEAGSAPGLSNLAAVAIGPATTRSFQGVPPGTYYVRLRAVNALGQSVVSNEVVIVVG